MRKEFDFNKEIECCANIDIDWEKLDNKTIMITGATGLVGKFLIEVLLKRNQLHNKTTKIVAVGRNRKKFEDRFADVENFEDIIFYEHDVQYPLDYEGRLDIIIHMASNTHPRLYATDPIGTEMTNILGTYYLLQKASQDKGCRFILTSSTDIYGDNQSAKEFLSETDFGYIDCNTLRAGYIEGKRASEALCNAFQEVNGVDFVIARLCRLYGPTMQLVDSKAISQFINRAANSSDIVLHSEGYQTFSYLYVYDAVAALLTLVANGKTGNAYNICDNKQCISLRDLAAIIAEIGGSKVVYNVPDELEMKGASTFKNVKLDATKLYGLGWKSEVEMKDGLEWTIYCIKLENNKNETLVKENIYNF